MCLEHGEKRPPGVFCAALDCLNALIIFLIIRDSSTLLALRLKLKLNGLSVGPLNNNSKLLFRTFPSVLANNSFASNPKTLPVMIALTALLTFGSVIACSKALAAFSPALSFAPPP